LRGFAVVAMIFDHMMIDFSYTFDFTGGLLGRLTNFSWLYLSSPLRTYMHPVFVALFVSISGICSSFSRNNLLRGAKLFAVALALSAATFLFGLIEHDYADYFIVFGILHMLSVSILIYALVTWRGDSKGKSGYDDKSTSVDGERGFKRLMRNIRPVDYIVLALGVVMIASGIFIERANIQISTNLFSPFGIYDGSFTSADYFPLLPWCGVFFLGAFAGRFFKKGEGSIKPAPRWTKPLDFVGRHALIMYLAHQVALFGILYLAAYLTGQAV